MAPSSPPPPTSTISSLISFAARLLDRLAPPETRSRLYAQTADFASARPLVFSFLAAQLAISLIPLLLFASFLISTLLFSLGAALLFTLFWFGVAALFLIPTLCVTGGIGVLVWVWGVTTYVSGKWALGFLTSTSSSSSSSSSLSLPSGSPSKGNNYESGESAHDDEKGGYKHLGTWPAGLSDEELKDFAGVKNGFPTRTPVITNGDGKEKGGLIKTENKFEVLGTD
ncbi:hypothetical protein QBC44DRAFT_366351 [Cladorrhinum sp. PSN332]|nr:hypothetical protein QBC44DRAFT_366351 [Cladorrhinum sp. PSN332]